MKRYRVTSFDFDSRALILTEKIDEEWAPKAKELHLQRRKKIKKQLLNEFGPIQGDSKLKNFIDLGPAYISIIAFHNKFFRQIRNAFVIGSYYPSLTSVCALGERILNHLILRLRNFYKHTPEYKKVYRKLSFDNWALAIDTLVAWEVLLPNVAKDYRKLADIRHSVIHFNPDTERNDRTLALRAIKVMSRIIKEQFSAFGNQPWFISNIPGANYIKKKAESQPFIKAIYLPNCSLIGPYHRVEFRNGHFLIFDDYHYEQKEISDEEFAQLLKNYREKSSKSR